MASPMATPGAFSWVELMTTDADGAAKFYGELFGWTVTAQGPGYALVQAPNLRLALNTGHAAWAADSLADAIRVGLSQISPTARPRTELRAGSDLRRHETMESQQASRRRRRGLAGGRDVA